MGIQRKVRASGKVFYYARLWHEGQEHVEGGFVTRAAAEKALAAMRKRLDAVKLGEPEPVARRDPPLADLLGDPDAEAPADGSYLGWMMRPGARVAPLYLRRLKTAIRALLPFWGERQASEVNADTLAEYQRTRLSATVRMGEANRQAAAERRRERGEPQAPKTKGAAPGAGRKVGPACVNREVMALRGALTWAADPTRDPTRRIVPVPWPKEIALAEPEPRNAVLTPDDEARLMRECRPEWLRDLVILLRATGLRSGEGLALTWGAVNLEDDAPYLVVLRSKTRKRRAVPLPEDAAAMLRARHKAATERAEAAKRAGKAPGPGGDLVFATSTGGAVTSSKAASKFLAEARRLGVKTEDGGRPTLHSLRHTVATRVMRQGFGEAEVAALLGHSRISAVTSRYLHSGMERLRSMVEAAAPGARPKLAIVRAEGEG